MVSLRLLITPWAVFATLILAAINVTPTCTTSTRIWRRCCGDGTKNMLRYLRHRVRLRAPRVPSLRRQCEACPVRPIVRADPQLQWRVGRHAQKHHPGVRAYAVAASAATHWCAAPTPKMNPSGGAATERCDEGGGAGGCAQFLTKTFSRDNLEYFIISRTSS